MWNREPELYSRGYYYARQGTGKNTKRKSLHTNQYDVAVSRLRDLIEYDKIQHIYIKDIFAEYQEAKRLQDTHNKNEYMWRSLQPFFGALRPDQITREACVEYKQFRQKSDGTILRELSTLRAALKWHDPTTPAVFDMPQAPPPKHDFLTRAEVQQLLTGCLEPHMKLYIILSISTAARKSALLELTWDRVDFERGLINLGVSNGNKKRATVPMNSTAEQILEEAYKGQLTDYVIEYRGRNLKDIKKGFARTVERSGLIKKVNPHMLRHTSAVWMAEGGVPMSEIAQYLGHTSTATTEKVYARFSPEYLKKAASVLEIGLHVTHKEEYNA
jgi:integrase